MCSGHKFSAIAMNFIAFTHSSSQIQIMKIINRYFCQKYVHSLDCSLTQQKYICPFQNFNLLYQKQKWETLSVYINKKLNYVLCKFSFCLGYSAITYTFIFYMWIPIMNNIFQFSYYTGCWYVICWLQFQFTFALLLLWNFLNFLF